MRNVRILLVEASAIVAAGFAIAAYIEAYASNIEMRAMVHGIEAIAENSKDVIDNEEQSILIQQKMLQNLLLILPQTEQTRRSLEHLVQANARHLKAVRAKTQQCRKAATISSKRQASRGALPNRKRATGRLQDANRKAEDIWSQIAKRGR